MTKEKAEWKTQDWQWEKWEKWEGHEPWRWQENGKTWADDETKAYEPQSSSWERASQREGRDGRQGARGRKARERRKESRKGVESKHPGRRIDQGPMKYGSQKWRRIRSKSSEAVTSEMEGMKK